MKNFKNTLPLVFSIGGLILLSSVIVYQSDTIADLRKSLFKSYDTIKESNKRAEEQLAINASLEMEVSLLKDSISTLNVKVIGLEKQVAALKNTVAQLNKKLGEKDKKLANFNNEIARLKQNTSGQEAKIAELERKRDALLDDMQQLDRQRIKAEQERLDAEQKQNQATTEIAQMESLATEKEQVIDEERQMPAPVFEKPHSAPAVPSYEMEVSDNIRLRQQQRLQNIMVNTKVHFTKMAARLHKEGNNLNKLDKDAWRYLVIEFSMDNPVQEDIVDESYLLQVTDLETNLPVPLNETNPSFPGGEGMNEGYGFKYGGEPVKVSFFNSEKKNSKNYAIQIWHVKSGVKTPLQNGQRQVVRDGEVLAL